MRVFKQVHMNSIFKMCHICRCYGEKNLVNLKRSLKRCSACQMISYCCKEHQVKDWSTHKEFCKVICQLKKEWNVNNVFQSVKSIALRNVGNDQDMYKYHSKSLNKFSADLTRAVIEILQRKLKEIEYQMIIFSRLCAVCYESNPELLVNCSKCPQATFCKEHLNDSNHESECLKIIKCFNTVKSVFYRFQSFSPLDIMMIQSPYHPAEKKLPSSMLKFIETRSTTDLSECGNGNTTIASDIKSTVLNRFLSDRFSRVFTILFAIEKLSLNLQSMVIHVVGANQGELLASDWELILHYLPNLMKLELIFIGPELFPAFKQLNQNCNRCKKEDRKLFIEANRKVYHEYTRGDNFLKPDMIACFHPGFHVHDSWKKSIKVFSKGQCPLLVTGVNTIEASMDKNFINFTFPSAKCFYYDYNPFTYISYQRHDIYVPIGANNQFMHLYKFLDKKTASN